MKGLIVISLALATAVLPAHANDGRVLTEQMPVMDFYMQIVPPAWKALVENGDLPCQMPAHAQIRDLGPLMSTVEITCADHRTFVVRQIRQLQIAPRD